MMRTFTIPIVSTALAALLYIRAGAAPGASGVTFTDITKAAGITFVHNSGRAGKKFLPETLG